MRLENKIILPFIIFFVSLILISLVFFDFMSLTKENYDNILTQDSRFTEEGNTIIYYNLIREAALNNYLISQDDFYAADYAKYEAKTHELYLLIIQGISSPELKDTYERQFEVWKQINMIERDVLDGKADADVLKSEEFQRLKDDFSDLRDFPKTFYLQKAKNDLVKNINNTGKYQLIVGAVIMITLLLVVFVFTIVKRDIVNPMKKMSDGLDNILDNKFNFRLEGDERSEMGKLIKKLARTTTNIGSDSKELRQSLSEKESMAKLATTMITKQKDDMDSVIKKLKDELKEKEDMAKLAMLLLQDKKKKK